MTPERRTDLEAATAVLITAILLLLANSFALDWMRDRPRECVKIADAMPIAGSCR